MIRHRGKRWTLGTSVAIAAGAVSLVAASAAPANAHATWTNLPPYGAGTLNSAHNRLSACDSRNDGRTVYLEYTWTNGRLFGGGRHSDPDPGASCRPLSPATGFWFTSYRVCVTPIGSLCTGWVRH
ncbi:hypothetical protein SMC26_15870 [Actinomadura fulvescens]|uniref:Secreted protein n=1 Tax=Actinomadura fulvescens TaxID=46160 RepID=A0ABN3QW60_9ACTN